MPNLLVVDDECAIREALRGILEEEGYKVFLAESAEACLDQLKKRGCNVVLLDIWLPGMDGLDALGHIRQLELESAPDVVIISSHATIETPVPDTKLGALYFLPHQLSIH